MASVVPARKMPVELIERSTTYSRALRNGAPVLARQWSTVEDAINHLCAVRRIAVPGFHMELSVTATPRTVYLDVPQGPYADLADLWIACRSSSDHTYIEVEIDGAITRISAGPDSITWGAIPIQLGSGVAISPTTTEIEIGLTRGGGENVDVLFMVVVPRPLYGEVTI